MTILEHLRRELEQARHDAAEAREQGWDDAAVIGEERAACLENQIDTLELANGNSLSFPMDGRAA